MAETPRSEESPNRGNEERKKGPKGPSPTPAEVEAQKMAKLERLVNRAEALLDRKEELDNQLNANIRTILDNGDLSLEERHDIGRDNRRIRRELEDIENEIEHIAKQIEKLSP